jgi:hypothetical protein
MIVLSVTIGLQSDITRSRRIVRGRTDKSNCREGCLTNWVEKDAADCSSHPER